MKDDMTQNPDSPVTRVYSLAIEANLPIIKHYVDLHTSFSSEYECYNFYLAQERDIKVRIQDAANNDPDGIQGTYNRINPTLQSPCFYSSYMINESDRIILTKYRTGSHSLKIQKGRYNRVDRNNRLCKCKAGIQDLTHVLLYCNITRRFRDDSFKFNDLQEFFEDLFNAPHFLRMVQHSLNIQ